MQPQTLTRREARRIFLSRQGLLQQNSFGRGRNAVHKAIDRLGWVQIDTISVVERAHHQVLRTRIKNYDPVMLHQLQQGNRQIFEYWSHAAAYLPLRDYRFYLPVMRGSALKRVPDTKMAGEILGRIKAEGPLQSRDFEAPPGKTSTGWWDWKPAKITLEQLFLSGELMISHRDGFAKIYDLRERVLPAETDTSMPTDSQWCEFIILRMLGALGIGTRYDLGYARGSIRRLANRDLKQPFGAALEVLLESGQVREIDCEGLSMFTTDDALSELSNKLGKRRVRFLSPFDNLVINRRRALELFGFDYQLECYVPEAKRKYGYFCMPILYGDELVGRMDAKVDRRRNHLEVRNLVLESQATGDSLSPALSEGLRSYARENACATVSILKSTPAKLLKSLSVSSVNI